MKAIMPVMNSKAATINTPVSVAIFRCHSIYSGATFAMNAIGKGSHIELQKFGINVRTVCPGYVRTDIGVNAITGTDYKVVRFKSVSGITPQRVECATLNGYLKGKREVVVTWFMHPVIKLYQDCQDWSSG
jgi:short-subunit dehydrogenase